MIDFNKPVQTRDGRKVRILCTDGPRVMYPVVGFIGSDTGVSSWSASGEFGGANCADLINVPERVERWLCKDFSKPDDDWTEHNVRQKSLRGAYWPHQICITYEDGKPVAVALEDCK